MFTSPARASPPGALPAIRQRAAPRDVSRARHDDAIGYLVWGGNCGSHILNRSARPTPSLDDHLPHGCIWAEDEADLPKRVRAAPTSGEAAE
jgi:hypothetical protein